MNVAFSQPKSFVGNIAQSVGLCCGGMFESVNVRFLYIGACGLFMCYEKECEGESGANLSMQMRIGTLL